MGELNYKPNILARTLAKKTVSKISILLPYPYQDFYWKMVRDGIVDSLDDFWAYGIKGKIHFYDMFDSGHFEKICEEILEDSTDAIIIGTEFYKQTIDFLNKCHARNIKVIVLNAEINSAPSLSYIGINSFSLGLLTGRIIKTTRGRRHVLIVHVSENIKNSPHLKNKELGVIESIGTDGKITAQSLTIPNPLPPPSNLLSLLKGIIETGNIDTLYITTSNAHLFADALHETFPDLFIIGHDLIENNIQHLDKNKINLIIDQNGYQMGYLSVKTWIDFYLLENTIPQKQYLPMDIVYPENLDFYLNNRRMHNV